MYILSAGKELETYHQNLERTQRVQAQLRHADRFFDLSRASPPMLPNHLRPTPVLLNLAHSSPHKSAGKPSKRKSAATAAGGAAGEQRTGVQSGIVTNYKPAHAV